MKTLSEEDKNFLHLLQHEMLNQDTVSQANPRFWVIEQQVKDYRVENDCDGFSILKDNEEVFVGEFEELLPWLEEEFPEIKAIDFYSGYFDILFENDESEFFDFSELQDFLNKFRPKEFDVITFRNRWEIVPNTMFLTKRECENHLKANRHNYNGTAHSYAMTAWRSPQVERLYKILEETDWQ